MAAGGNGKRRLGYGDGYGFGNLVVVDPIGRGKGNAECLPLACIEQCSFCRSVGKGSLGISGGAELCIAQLSAVGDGGRIGPAYGWGNPADGERTLYIGKIVVVISTIYCYDIVCARIAGAGSGGANGRLGIDHGLILAVYKSTIANAGCRNDLTLDDVMAAGGNGQ